MSGNKHRLVISIGDTGMNFLRQRCKESGMRSPASVAACILDCAAMVHQTYDPHSPDRAPHPVDVAREINEMFADAADTESPRYGCRTRQTKSKSHD